MAGEATSGVPREMRILLALLLVSTLGCASSTMRDDAGADGPPTGSCATLTECCPRAIPEYQPYCRTTAMGGDEAMCARLVADRGYCPSI